VGLNALQFGFQEMCVEALILASMFSDLSWIPDDGRQADSLESFSCNLSQPFEGESELCPSLVLRKFMYLVDDDCPDVVFTFKDGLRFLFRSLRGVVHKL